MKYLIVGTGGTGACIGSFLAKNNHDVTFIARGKHLETINENGLTINSDRIGKFNLKPLTYSPCLKAGDSWIQTIFAY